MPCRSTYGKSYEYLLSSLAPVKLITLRLLVFHNLSNFHRFSCVNPLCVKDWL